MKMPRTLLLCALLPLLAGTPLAAATPEESFRKSFPNIPIQSMTPTAIPGVYEIVSGGRVAYYAPGPDYLITGSLITREGKNLTEERGRELLGNKLKEIPLDKALKMGSGAHTVLEITDPDCPYCRQASAYLGRRNDLTRHVFFLPLPIHKDAEAKVRYILCAEDKAKAYEDAMTGKLDDMKFKVCQDAAAEDLYRAHREIMARAGMQSTPLFLIDGQVVSGADIPLMERILGSGK
jgi:thiol:disulfide interchange protein DsbC